MARWGRVDYKQFERLQKRMEKMEQEAKREFFEAAAKELALRLLRKVKKKTPTGDYPPGTGLIGGTLRRGWTAGKEQSLMSFVNSIQVRKIGDTYEINIENAVEYASYVEFGHRTRDHKKWIPGQFMLTISEEELDAQKDKILEKKLDKFLEEVFK